MELIPEVIIDKIYDYFLDLCLIEHRTNFYSTLEQLRHRVVTDTVFYSSWATLSDGTLDERFMIFCNVDIITYSMIDIEKIHNTWKLRDSWLYRNNSWNYSKTEYINH